MTDIRFPADTDPVIPTADDKLLLSDSSDSGNIKEVTVQDLWDANPGGNGDMEKSTYDTNDDGRVDQADKISDGTTEFTPSTLQTALDAKANDSSVVKNTGDQSIFGVKTFFDIVSGSFKGLAGVLVRYFSDSTTLSEDSDEYVPTQKAVKTYVDTGLASKLDTSAYDPPTTEEIQDIIGAMVQGGTHTNITVVYDDASGVINLTGSAGGGGGGGYTQEEVEDIIGGLTTQGTGVNVSYDDSGNVLTISLSGESFTTAYKTKLDAIEANATADQTGAEIKALYEALSDTNAYTDAEKTKLAGIEANATADQTGAEIKTAYEAEPDTNAFTDAEKTKLAGLTAGDGNVGTKTVDETPLNGGDIMVYNDVEDKMEFESLLSKERTYLKQQSFANNVLTDGATINRNLDDAQVAYVALGGNRTIASPTNKVSGGTYILAIQQDATGSRTVTRGSDYDRPGGGAPTLTTAGLSIDIVSFVCIGSTMYGVASLDFQ